MIFTAFSDGRFNLRGRWTRCALGRSGVAPAAEKREGDGCSPIGTWPLRRAYFRPDRLAPPPCALPLAALRPEDGWCDAPEDPLYNRPAPLPYPASAERLWREDSLYDLILVLGHNDDPPVPYLGSAIFLHLAHEDFRPTEGCVALCQDDVLAVLAAATPLDFVEIRQV